MFFTGSCCDCGCVQPESTMATPTIPASRVLVTFFIVFSLPNWLLLASFLNFGVAGTLLGWYPFLSLSGHRRREPLPSPRTGLSFPGCGRGLQYSADRVRAGRGVDRSCWTGNGVSSRLGQLTGREVGPDR